MLPCPFLSQWRRNSILRWEMHIYNVGNLSSKPRVTLNNDHDIMMYLMFIIDNHESLPPCTVFIRGHPLSWHQVADTVSLSRSLRLPGVQDVGYASLRCDWYPSCRAEIRSVLHIATVGGIRCAWSETEYVNLRLRHGFCLENRYQSRQQANDGRSLGHWEQRY